MNKIIILVGNVGSGKTTIAREFVERGYVAVARDILRYAIGDGKYIFSTSLEKLVWDTELFMFNELLRLGKNIVVDEISISKAMRERYFFEYFYGKYRHYEFIAIEMPKLTKEQSVQRKLQEPHQQPDSDLWAGVWEKFDKQYQKPTEDEGFSRIIKLKSDESTQFHLDEIITAMGVL